MGVTPVNLYGPPDPRKSNLTFGLELEFAIAISLNPSGSIDPHPSDPRRITGFVTGPHDSWVANLHEHVASTLFSVGIPAIAVRSIGEAFPTGHENSWVVKHDNTIKAPSLEGYHFLPIEINSPPYYYGHESAFHEIGVVCQVLRDTYRISCNRSCGVQVHVGNGMEGFAFEAVQNLLATIWTFEEQIETIHPKHRIDNEGMCPSFKRHSELSRSHSRNGKLDIRAGLEDILNQRGKSVQVFAHMTEPRTAISQKGGTRLAYHLGDVSGERPITCLYKRTVEFRQHKGSLELEELELWIKFCVQLMMFADSIDKTKLANFLRAHVGTSVEECPLAIVLEKLGMPWLAYCYPKKIAVDREMANEEEVLCSIELGMDKMLTPL
ncbi:hypothetical protein ONS96_013723 [Cadophora gregata f. sp. sojae]|nr:hypothetical protein ONS96_013723 [Cadophora gregata f. sp. sojae]